ncbi:related to cellulose binding protein CEL1 [Cephalotrichum gorgonifer]|uniref:lytic cellulose monooxygenase (C4-dehydrogenating) n=1 Tax=Cephalotrichum gorgonifer TaxID=2041049 RepID=A0AAE8MZR1_9PEZI|nr:related to cellulose binding protein CEL1 [Cephalotrichum gorgonifer]
MKFSVASLVAVAQVASAHYFFDSNVINGAAGRPFTYIRDFTRQTKYNPIKFSSNPAQDIRDNSFIDGDDIRCNQGAFKAAGNTDVLEVGAGGDVTVKLGVGARMEHPGPSLFYMSRAPGDDVKAYDGSGDWFKIGEEGVCNQGADFTRDAWCSWARDTLTATIPAGTPDGEYLLRFEHIGIHRSHVNQPEHYVSCVQVKVVGGGNGTPGPMVKLPGAYKDSDPYAKFSIYGGFKSFPMPGPAVWDGTSSSAGGQTPPKNEPETSPTPSAPETSPSPVPPKSEPETSPAPATGGDKGASPCTKCAPLYGRCGGRGFTGPTCCSQGTCRQSNPWYSQCL